MLMGNFFVVRFKTNFLEIESDNKLLCIKFGIDVLLFQRIHLDWPNDISIRHLWAYQSLHGTVDISHYLDLVQCNSLPICEYLIDFCAQPLCIDHIEHNRFLHHILLQVQKHIKFENDFILFIVKFQLQHKPVKCVENAATSKTCEH